MIKIVDGNIYLTRGDSALLEITIKDEDGQTWEPTSTDKVIFCIKTNATDPEPLVTIQAPEEDTDITIMPSDTKDLTYGQYIYDVHVETAAGNIYTVIANKVFEVGKEAHTSWS